MRSAEVWVAILATSVFLAGCGGAAVAPSPSQALAKPTPLATFRLIPEPTVAASGSILLFATPSSTSIEVKVTGLKANSSHVSHVDLGSCQQRGAIAFPLHPVVANGKGEADTRTTLNLKYPPPTGHWYVVVHAGPDMQGTNASYLLCGNLF